MRPSYCAKANCAQAQWLALLKCIKYLHACTCVCMDQGACVHGYLIKMSMTVSARLLPYRLHPFKLGLPWQHNLATSGLPLTGASCHLEFL